MVLTVGQVASRRTMDWCMAATGVAHPDMVPPHSCSFSDSDPLGLGLGEGECTPVEDNLACGGRFAFCLQGYTALRVSTHWFVWAGGSFIPGYVVLRRPSLTMF